MQADRGSPEQIEAARASQGAQGRQVEAAKSIEPACNGLASSVRLRKLACNGLASSVRLRKFDRANAKMDSWSSNFDIDWKMNNERWILGARC